MKVKEDFDPANSVFQQWTCIFRGGVSWRSSPDFDDRAAGQGPNFGDIVEGTSLDIGKPSNVLFLKARAAGNTFLYLPVNTPDGKPVMRPDVAATTPERIYDVVYTSGVSWRCGPSFGDRDRNAPAQDPAHNEKVKGREIMGLNGMRMVKVGIGQYLPMFSKIKDGQPVLKVTDDPVPPATGPLGPPLGAPPPGPPLVQPPTLPAPPPSGYPPIMGPPPSAVYPVPAAPAPPPATNPAPPTWSKHFSDGKPYWANSQTGETTWNDPQAPPPPPEPSQPAPAPTQAAVLQPEWKAAQDPTSGRTYWYNTATNETTWVDPYTPKSAITSFFAKGYLTKEEKATFWQAFDEIGRLGIPTGFALKSQPRLYDAIANTYIQMDRGNNNVLMIGELNELLKEIGMFEGAGATSHIMRQMDLDGRGTIQLDEFVHEMVIRANEKARGINMGGVHSVGSPYTMGAPMGGAMGAPMVYGGGYNAGYGGGYNAGYAPY